MTLDAISLFERDGCKERDGDMWARSRDAEVAIGRDVERPSPFARRRRRRYRSYVIIVVGVCFLSNSLKFARIAGFFSVARFRRRGRVKTPFQADWPPGRRPPPPLAAAGGALIFGAKKRLAICLMEAPDGKLDWCLPKHTECKPSSAGNNALHCVVHRVSKSESGEAAPVFPGSAISEILIAINSLTIKDNLACRVCFGSLSSWAFQK